MESKTKVSSHPASVENLSASQRERLAYIDFRLYFLGEVRRQDLLDRFGIAPAVATRDFAQYKELFLENIEFDGKTKSYIIGKNFSPAFSHILERVLSALTQGFGDGVNPMGGAQLNCELPPVLNRPSMNILAPISRAIHLGKAVQIKYQSHTSGGSKREIVPFALANDGLRWHVRAFDRKSKEFRDFVLTRMSEAVVINDRSIEQYERPSEDIQWNRIVELDLVPHPNLEHPEVVEADFGMTDGVLHVKIRAAIAGYVLRQWIVDCTPKHSLKGKEYRLWLRNHLALYGVNSTLFAPGYEVPK